MMRATNYGVQAALFHRAVEFAENHAPQTGYRGSNHEAPVFDRERATVEVHPLPEGGCEVRVTMPGTRFNTTSPAGGAYNTNFVFLHHYLYE